MPISKFYTAGQGCTLIDVLPKAKTIWPEISEKTRVIPTSAGTIIVPIFNSLAVEWRVGNEARRPSHGLIGWYDKPNWQGKFWRIIGGIFRNQRLYQRGRLPRYKRRIPLFGQVTILLQRHNGFDFAAGYDAVHDILAVGIDD